MSERRKKAYIYLLINAAIWGIAGVVVKLTLREITPFVFLAYRFLITLAVLIPIAIIIKTKIPRDRKILWRLFIVSILSTTINLGLLFYGISYTSVLDQTVISASAPILIVAASAIFLNEKIIKREKIGILITIIGNLVIVLQPILEGGAFKAQNAFGNFLILLSNLAYVIYVILTKEQLKEKIDPFLIVTFSFVVGFVTILPFAIFEAHGVGPMINQVRHLTLLGQSGVFYMALLSGALGYFLYQLGQKSIEASEASLFTYLQPIFVAPFALLLLHEQISTPFIIGSLVIAFGIFVAEFKKRRYN